MRSNLEALKEACYKHRIEKPNYSMFSQNFTDRKSAQLSSLYNFEEMVTCYIEDNEMKEVFLNGVADMNFFN